MLLQTRRRHLLPGGRQQLPGLRQTRDRHQQRRQQVGARISTTMTTTIDQLLLLWCQ